MSAEKVEALAVEMGRAMMVARAEGRSAVDGLEPYAALLVRAQEVLRETDKAMRKLIEGNFGPNPWQGGFSDMRSIADEVRSISGPLLSDLDSALKGVE